MLFLSLGIVITLLILVGLVVVWWRSRQRGFAYGVGDRVTLDGVEVGQVLHPAAHKMPACLTLYVAVEADHRFTIIEEGWLHRLFKGWQINRELQTRDRRFDQAFYLESDQHRELLTLLANSRVRAAITELFASGFTHLQLAAGYLQLHQYPFKPATAPQGEALAQARSRLALIARALPSPPSALAVKRDPPRRFRAPLGAGPMDGRQLAAFASGILLLITGFTLFFHGSVGYPPLAPATLVWQSLAVGVLVYSAYLTFLVRLLRGRAASHRPILSNAALALIGIGLGAVGGGFTLNGMLDASPLQTHSALVTGKRYTSNKDGYKYYLELQGWNPAREREELQVARNLYQRAGVGRDHLVVETRAGAFGTEWVVHHYPDL